MHVVAVQRLYYHQPLWMHTQADVSWPLARPIANAEFRYLNASAGHTWHPLRRSELH